MQFLRIFTSPLLAIGLFAACAASNDQANFIYDVPTTQPSPRPTTMPSYLDNSTLRLELEQTKLEILKLQTESLISNSEIQRLRMRIIVLESFFEQMKQCPRWDNRYRAKT